MRRVKFLVHRLDRISRIVASLYKKYPWPSPAYWHFMYSDGKVKQFEARCYARWVEAFSELHKLVFDMNQKIGRNGNYRIVHTPYGDLIDGYCDSCRVEFCNITDVREYNKLAACGKLPWRRVA